MTSKFSIFLSLLLGFCSISTILSMNDSKSKSMRRSKKNNAKFPKITFKYIGKNQTNKNRNKRLFVAKSFFQTIHTKQMNKLPKSLDNKLKKHSKKNPSYPCNNQLDIKKYNINKIEKQYQLVLSKLYRSEIILKKLLSKRRKIVKFYDKQKKYEKSREIKNLVASKEFQKDIDFIKKRLERIQYNKPYATKCLSIWDQDYWFKNVYCAQEAEENFGKVLALSQLINTLYGDLTKCRKKINKEFTGVKKRMEKKLAQKLLKKTSNSSV